MSQAPNIDGVLITWGDRLFYPSNRVVKVKPQPRPGADAARLRAAAIRKRIEATVVGRAPQVMVKVTGGGRGMKAISARVARAVHRAFGCAGAVLHGRYHLRILRTPREVRSALAYVLLNVRKHFKQRWGYAPAVRLDEASSGRWFEGWRREPPGLETHGEARAGPREVARPRTWLLIAGWRRHGLIDPAEVPGR